MFNDNPLSPSYQKAIVICRNIYTVTDSEDLVINHLSEMASREYKCPDRCDDWACDFFDKNEKAIKMKKEEESKKVSRKITNEEWSILTRLFILFLFDLALLLSGYLAIKTGNPYSLGIFGVSMSAGIALLINTIPIIKEYRR